MIEELEIYGFGSFFKECVKFQDIDILIVHFSNKYESCQFAISCKQMLLSNLNYADVTILSKTEELQTLFIEKSNAIHLGKVCEVSVVKDLQAILNRIKQFVKSE